MYWNNYLIDTYFDTNYDCIYTRFEVFFILIRSLLGSLYLLFAPAFTLAAHHDYVNVFKHSVNYIGVVLVSKYIKN